MLHQLNFQTFSCRFVLGCAALLLPVQIIAQDEAKNEPQPKTDAPQKFSVADGYLNFSAPGNWKKTKPKFDFFHAEFEIPKVDGDEQNGRITFSQVGGSIEQNLDRWIVQFTDARENEDAIKKTTKTVDGKEVQLISIRGTFGGGGPMSPKQELKDYVLFGAVIEAENGNNNIYVKAYGPKKTMAANQKHLETLIEKMTVAEN